MVEFNDVKSDVVTDFSIESTVSRGHRRPAGAEKRIGDATLGDKLRKNGEHVAKIDARGGGSAGSKDNRVAKTRD